MSQNLGAYVNTEYSPGRNKTWQVIWYVINAVVLNSYLFPISRVKTFLLKVFGAKIGKGVVIKPKVNIKYPWLLSIGNNCWIGENVWIDNLTHVSLGSDVCISQGAMLLTGNHNYKLPTFDLITQSIVIENSCWVGAQSVVLPGTKMEEGSILAVGSIGGGILEKNQIYQGNKAVKVRSRN